MTNIFVIKILTGIINNFLKKYIDVNKYNIDINDDTDKFTITINVNEPLGKIAKKITGGLVGK